jgi:hypothetical protein
MRARAIFFLLIVAFLPSAAHAGMIAIYSGGFGSGYRIEIAEDGDMRGDLDSGDVLLVRDGEAFLIEERLTGPIVTRVEDLAALWAEKAGSVAPAAGNPVAFPFVEQGKASVNGRDGTAYFLRQDDGKLSAQPVLVLSNDPELMMLGPALARMHRIVAQRDAASDQAPFRDGAAMVEALIGRIEKAVPLQIFDMKLMSVEIAAITADRFALPAEPETREALRTRLAAEASAEAEAKRNPQRSADISQAIFSQGRLWLLDDEGKLTTVAEGEDARSATDPGDYVGDLCRGADGPIVVTAKGRRASKWLVRRWRGGRWEAGPAIDGRGEPLIALACGSEGEILITDKRLISIRGDVVAEMRLSGEMPRSFVRSTSLATAGDIYLGLNAGEWGGGLRRIDRKSGRVVMLEHNVSGDLCDGPLNSSCDPVQGIAVIPWKPQCVAAAVGLIHMLAHGRIVEICGNRIEQLYAKASLGASPEKQAQIAAGQSGDSTAFFGLIRVGNSLISVGHDGLYRFTGPGEPAFQPLPRFKSIGGVLVSFALPEVVLLVTRINQRVSVSGGAPMIVPR